MRREGRRCFGFTGRAFQGKGCAAAGTSCVQTTLGAGGTWRVGVKGLELGRHTISVRAVDNAGNVQALPAVQRVRLTR